MTDRDNPPAERDEDDVAEQGRTSTGGSDDTEQADAADELMTTPDGDMD
jgi:hypothetical protein